MLVFALFFLCCTLLCGSVLAVNLSEQFAASNEAVQKEQSRLLARSGWNMALEQLQLYGVPENIQSAQSSGDIAVSIEQSDKAPAAWSIDAEGTSGVYHRNASGVVQCFPFPFADMQDWAVIALSDVQTKTGILLLEDEIYQLSADCNHPLGITSIHQQPVTVKVEDSVNITELYIYGDLLVSGALSADAIYVTGTIIGSDFIQCNELVSGYAGAIPYQIRVLERSIS